MTGRCNCCSAIWRNGKPGDSPAVARWTFHNGNVVRLCLNCLHAYFDLADDDEDLEPVAWHWIEGMVAA